MGNRFKPGDRVRRKSSQPFGPMKNGDEATVLRDTDLDITFVEHPSWQFASDSYALVSEAPARAASVKSRGRPLSLDSQKQVEALTRIHAGESVASIARELGTSRPTIMRVREAGLVHDLCGTNATQVRMASQDKPVATKDTNPKDAIGDKKVPLWLLSPIAKAQWAVCQFVGMVKYGAWNWRVAGVRSSIYLSAMQRHLDAYMSGEEVDPVDQTPHLGHIMACAAILIDAKAAGKLTDDRPPSVELRTAYAEVEKQMVATRERYADMCPTHHTIRDSAK